MVLRKVLDLRPETLTRDELIRELTDSEPGDCPKFEALRRAVGELAGSGLLHRPGTDEMVRPTRAAVRYAELTEEAV